MNIRKLAAAALITATIGGISAAATSTASATTKPAGHVCVLNATMFEDGSWAPAGGTIDGRHVITSWVVGDWRKASLKNGHLITAWAPGMPSSGPYAGTVCRIHATY